MSLLERRPGGRRAWGGRVAALAALLALVALQACTVRPLYGSGPAVGTTGATSVPALSQIAVDPVTTRYGLEVRNHLIFLLNGGRGEPADPLYRMRLNVTAQRLTTAVRQVTSVDQEPTAGAVNLIARYSLVDPASGEVVVQGRREFSASFDRPRQEFAGLRAARDAEDRAARELAELLRLAVAQDLDRIGVR